MAIEWRDAFHLTTTTAVAARYTSGSVTALQASGRTGQCISMTGPVASLTQTVSATRDKIVGFAMKQTSFAVDTIFLRLMEGGTTHLYLQLNATTFTISIYRGDGTLLATTSAGQVWTANFFIHLEFKAYIHDTEGSIALRANEVSWINLGNLDTRNGGTGVVDTVKIANTTNNADLWFDDYIIATWQQPIGTGQWYGNIRIETLFPEDFGTITGWTPAGNVSNWQNVDETAHNSDVDYNYSATVNASDLYTMQNISTGTGSNVGIQLTYVARKDDAIERVTAPLIRTNATVYQGDNDSLTTSYVHYYESWNFNPNTSTYFSLSEINALQAGIQVRG